MTLSRQERHKAGRYPIVGPQRSSGVAARSAPDSGGQGAPHQRGPEPSTLCTCGRRGRPAPPGPLHEAGGIDPETMEPIPRCPLFRNPNCRCTLVPVVGAEMRAWRLEHHMGVAPMPRET